MTRSLFGHIERLGPDHYKIYWRENGKQRSKRIRGTRDDAELFLAERRLGIGNVPSYTWQQYWERIVEPSFDGLSEHTIADYKRLWDKQLKEHLGSLKVADTTFQLVQEVLNTINAPSRQAYAMRLLRKMCNMAIRDHLLDRNPVDRTIKLKPRVRREKHYLDSKDAKDYIKSIRNTMFEPIVLMMLGCGLSLEEACGVCWEDITKITSGGHVYAAVDVSKAVTCVEGKTVVKGTKNRFRTREAVLGRPFAQRLLALAKDKSGPVVPKLDGGYVSPLTITHKWKAWCESHSVKHVRFGDMRSIFSTWCGEAGCPDSLSSLAMGHSDGTTRGENYQQNTRKGMILVADCISSIT